MPNEEDALKVVDSNMKSSVDKLLDLISIPSISSDPAGKPVIEQAAHWLHRELSRLGLAAQVVQTTGHPLVLAHSTETFEGKRPRLLFYGHYDVQPVGSPDQWNHQPFAPKVIEEEGRHRFYGRGASDSKSQLWTFIEGLSAWKAVHSEFPGQIIVLLEGEEEAGSASLPAFIEAHRQALLCDVAFICDSDMWSPNQPALTIQLKGLVHEKVTVFAPNRDLHSGLFGAVAANPIRILSSILAGIHDDDGRVLIEGFYDGVKDIPNDFCKQWQTLSRDADFFDKIDVRGGVVEAGYSPLEATWGRPTVDMNGITGGNQGPGERSVLPGCATARLSFRLVGGQEPEKVRRSFQNYVRSRLPAGCSAEFEGSFGSCAVTMSQDSPFVTATSLGLEKEWGRPTVLKGTGGAIPLAQQFKETLGVDCIVIGFSLPDDAAHGPDERYDTQRLRKGIRSWVRILEEIKNIPQEFR